MATSRSKIATELVVIAGLIVLIALYVSRHHSASERDSDTDAVHENTQPLEGISHNDERANIVREIYSTPINFIGQVVDSNGAIVEGAQVHISIVDKVLGAASEWVGVSDVNGMFMPPLLKGAAINVGVSKDGYYEVKNESTGYFSYAGPDAHRTRRELPTKDKPAVFVLKKRGEASPLVPRDWDAVLPLDGTMVGIDLARGRKTEKGDLMLVARANKTDPDPNSHEKYDWQFKMSIPGGGFLARTNDFDFIAPADGYQTELEFGKPRDDVQWRDGCSGEYFLKLGDGRYARMKLRFTTGGAHFASITSYVNPVPGDRNLEYDPQKKAKP